MQNILQIQKSLKIPILVKKKENLFYLTGRDLKNNAEEFLLLTPKAAVAFGYGLEKIDWFKKTDSLSNIGKYLKGYKELNIEYGFTYREGEYLKSKLQIKNFKITPAKSPVDAIRQVKTTDEISKIKKSMQIVQQVFKLVRREIKKPGITEIQLAKYIENAGLNLGAEDVSFPAIVASGKNSAVPHHVPGNKKIKLDEPVVLDFGFKYKNYCSDFTRTVFLKSAPEKLAKIYNQVEKAYLGSMSLLEEPSRVHQRDFLNNKKETLRSGAAALNGKALTGADLHNKAVEVLAKENLDRYFPHTLGHGAGLEIHEGPYIYTNSNEPLKNRMVFSIEPGVYIESVGGVRIEDLVYLEKGKICRFINVPTDIESNIL